MYIYACRNSLQATYLHEDHGRNLLGRESLGLAQVLDLDNGVSALVDDLEGPRLDILLDNGILESPSNQTPVVPAELVTTL